MKSLVVYSTRTGNTRKLAQALYEMLPEPKDLFSIETAPSPDGYDFIALGFWVDRGTADHATLQYIEKIKGKKVGIFGTSGAFPDSDHTRECMESVTQLLAGNAVLGGFICQGRIDPAVARKMDRLAPEDETAPNRPDRIAEAARHPNEKDLQNLRAAFAAMLKRLEGGTHE